jgi:DNA-binding Lrp family transcriptional regulator
LGRGVNTQPPVPATTIREAFQVRQDGQIVRRSTGEPATFPFKGKSLVRVYYQGQIRRFAAGRIAWAIAVGEWPKGVVKARNGVDDDLRLENLILTKRGPRPFDQGKGGMASSLERRSQTGTALLMALAENPDATVPQLSQLVGRSESCCCIRLAKLEAQGLTCSPKCQAHIRWQLSQTGKALAMNGQPLIDDTGRDILTIIARAPVRQLELARRLGVCSLTAKRRLGMLIEQGLIDVNASRYAITSGGRAALGDAAPKPWLRSEAISAAAASDVQRRIQFPNEMSATERTRISSLNASKARANARRNGNAAFNSLDMMG